MREHKYRGKRLDNGEWVYGSLRIEGEHAYILTDDYTILCDEPDYYPQAMGCGLEDNGIVNRYDACEYGFMEAVERFREYLPIWQEVDPETIGEFAGLYGKNEQEIYEGDIVEFSIVNYYSPNGETIDSGKIGIIKFSENETAIVIGDKYSDYFKSSLILLGDALRADDKMEVIDNIHDNLDLLESEVEHA